MDQLKHLISLKEFDGKWMQDCIDLAIDTKKNPEAYKDKMKNKTLIMLFQKASTRTRTSFEAGATQLGGHAIFIDWRTTQLDKASLADEAKCLARYGDIIMARVKKNEHMYELANNSRVPVINGCDDMYHPCQSLGDIMTIQEHLGPVKGKKLVYFGINNNVSNTLSLAAAKLGMKFVLCCPDKDRDAIDRDLHGLLEKSGNYEEISDPKEAIMNADVIYTDTWVNMEFFNDPAFAEEKDRRIRTFMPYQLNKELHSNAPHALIMHDLPAHVGYEITRDMIDHERSIIFDQAENRMHIQKAIMLKLLDLA
ncbi:ornithine carbamoyltransferase [Candidatus Woesearchaeota archaeon]|nr:ornithine carbamoyltransferase [Candidatus Woesearchaeota archaeon]